MRSPTRLRHDRSHFADREGGVGVEKHDDGGAVAAVGGVGADVVAAVAAVVVDLTLLSHEHRVKGIPRQHLAPAAL